MGVGKEEWGTYEGLPFTVSQLLMAEEIVLSVKVADEVPFIACWSAHLDGWEVERMRGHGEERQRMLYV